MEYGVVRYVTKAVADAGVRAKTEFLSKMGHELPGAGTTVRITIELRRVPAADFDVLDIVG